MVRVTDTSTVAVPGVGLFTMIVHWPEALVVPLMQVPPVIVAVAPPFQGPRGRFPVEPDRSPLWPELEMPGDLHVLADAPVFPRVFEKQPVLPNQRIDVLDRLHEIKSAALIMVGEHDHATPPELSEQMSRHWPGSEYCVIPGAAHAGNIEQADFFNRRVLDFLLR